MEETESENKLKIKIVPYPLISTMCYYNDRILTIIVLFNGFIEEENLKPDKVHYYLNEIRKILKDQHTTSVRFTVEFYNKYFEKDYNSHDWPMEKRMVKWLILPILQILYDYVLVNSDDDNKIEMGIVYEPRDTFKIDTKLYHLIRYVERAVRSDYELTERPPINVCLLTNDGDYGQTYLHSDVRYPMKEYKFSDESKNHYNYTNE